MAQLGQLTLKFRVMTSLSLCPCTRTNRALTGHIRDYGPIWCSPPSPHGRGRPIRTHGSYLERPSCRTGRGVAKGAPDDVFVLDFDGVLCDSGGEVMSAGLAVARERWPRAFAGDVDDGALVESLNRVRPRLISGFESAVMARFVSEEGTRAVEDILGCEDWSDRVEELLEGYGCSRDDLQGDFERWRRERIESDYEGWLALNPLYKDVREALEDCSSPTYFASSKSGRRLIPLLRSLLGIDVGEESPRVFHMLIPPNALKLEALERVMARPVASDGRTQLHFVDDRLETLEYVLENAGDELLGRYDLYLASWGYCTDEEIRRARRTRGLRVIELEEFCELLRFGIIMGVHDGCQDTEDEARDAVYKPRSS